MEFAHRYADAKDEDRDAKPFWKDLLELYGVDPRQVGAFEERVRMHGKPGVGKIDYFAPHKFIIEHKSRGKDLDAAYRQAMEYFDALLKDDRPRYIIVSDFASFRIVDLEASEKNRSVEFALKDLSQQVKQFAFFTDEDVRIYKPEEPIDVKAVRAIGKLHDALKSSNYDTQHLSPLLTRLVFLFFADDTGIFEQNAIRAYLEDNTTADGSDIGGKLTEIFQVLNTSEDKRQTTLHSALANLPYVNGGLFAASLPVVFASRAVRDTILACAAFDWSRVSPAIFGSMFQSVMNEKERHDLGAHYTSEINILKVINGLFLEDLQAELEAAKTNCEKLLALQDKLAAITLLDPACGCGNFLVVAYRELRKIENEIIARLHKTGSAKVEAGHMVLPMEVDIKKLSKMSVERMYGIEIDSFPAEVAKLSLWLMDHKMNMELGALFGKPLTKLPLTEAPHIVQGNALRLDWESVVPKDKLTHILGNPPFLGSRVMDKEQKQEMYDVFGKLKGVGELDYVTCWYKKAAEYIQGTTMSCAFVSTNSITQGEQVGILWPELAKLGLHIRFAHRTFKWSNEATGKAAVYCVIVGFGLRASEHPTLYEYEDIKGEPNAVQVKQINPYLINAPDVFIVARRTPLVKDTPQAAFGSMPNDGGQFLFDEQEKNIFLAQEPNAEKYMRPMLSAKEYLQGGKRFCLWLKDASPSELRTMPEVMRRIENVRLLRSNSSRAATQALAQTPSIFGEDRQPASNYILIPRVSSENRLYVPMSLFGPDNIAGDTCVIVPGADLYHLGVLQSEMHMGWMRVVCGRLESRYRYSNEVVYNNFPWPEHPSDEQKREVEAAAQAVLDARAAHAGATLADLYDPLTMPKDLLDAHHHLDRAVDACYGKRKFKSEEERLEYLFDKYKSLTTNR